MVEHICCNFLSAGVTGLIFFCLNLVTMSVSSSATYHMSQILPCYDYTLNAILVEPIYNFESKTICASYRKVFYYLTARGYKTMFNVIDNQETESIKSFIKEKVGQYQFVEPGNHRANASERAVQTVKDHFMASLCTTYNKFPAKLLDYLLPYSQETLNLLQASGKYPTKSAYKGMGRIFLFDSLLIVPPGTKAIDYESPTNRASWAPRGTAVWHLHPAKDHYRAAKVYVRDTNRTRISTSARFYPQHCSSLP